MRTRKIMYNSLTSAISQVLTLLTGFILPRLYIVTYGSELNGLIASILECISYFSYVEAGLGSALIYALYKPLAERDADEINGIVSLAKRSYIKASGLYFLLVLGLSAIYPCIITGENTDHATVILLVLVIGAFGALDFYTMAKYRVLLTADQRVYVISLVSILAQIVNFTCMFLLIRESAHIVLVRAIPLASFAIRSCLLYAYTKYKYPYIKYNRPADHRYLTSRWDALVMQLSVNISLSAPVIIISVFCSLKTASVYAVYNMICAGLTGIISIFSAGVAASFGNVMANREYTVLKKAHRQFEFLIFGITTVLYACTLILINPFVSIYTRGITDINYVNPVYGLLFVIWGILYNVRIPYTALVHAAGLYREVRKVNVLQVVLFLALSLIFVRLFSVSGVLAAMIIAALYWGTDVIFLVKRLIIGDLPNETFGRIIRMFMIVVLSWLPFLFWIQITASTLGEWFFWAAGVGMWCCTATLIINYLLDKMVCREIFARLKALRTSG